MHDIIGNNKISNRRYSINNYDNYIEIIDNFMNGINVIYKNYIIRIGFYDHSNRRGKIIYIYLKNKEYLYYPFITIKKEKNLFSKLFGIKKTKIERICSREESFYFFAILKRILNI